MVITIGCLHGHVICCKQVPQFSFTQLVGTTGIEVISTGEVACFGEDHYEAYLKALSTGFNLSNKTVLVSIGWVKLVM